MDPYLGEIRLFAGQYAPVNWAYCNGALISISANNVLFSLLGTTWGGDGVSTFGLPNLSGRLPVGQGQGIGLTPRVLGQTGGLAQVTIVEANLPAHSHTLFANSGPGTTSQVAENVGLAAAAVVPIGTAVRYVPANLATTPLAMDMKVVSVAPGGPYPHANVMPGMGLNYIICTTGLYPERAQ